MTSKDTDTKDAAARVGIAAAELTAARAALTAADNKTAALRRIARAEETKIQADRRKAALGA